MKKICMFCTTWGTGGIETFVCNILSQIDLENFRVDIVTNEILDDLYITNLNELGVRVVELSKNRKRYFLNMYLFWKLIKKNRYDILHMHLYQSVALIYILIAKVLKIKIRIAHSHNAKLITEKGQLLKNLIHICFKNLLGKNATHYVACSKNAAEFMFTRKVIRDNKYKIINDGIDLNRFWTSEEKRKKIREQYDMTDKFVIGNVGRFCFQKNQEYLIYIFKNILEIRKNAVLIFIGEGAKKQELMELTRKLEIDEKVKFWGVTNNIDKYYAVMDILVSPTRFEGLGMTLVEAQAAGLKVVCSDQVPLEACIVPENFVRIPLDARQDWINEILKPIFRNDECVKEKIRKSGYDIKNVVRQVTFLYENKVF